MQKANVLIITGDKALEGELADGLAKFGLGVVVSTEGDSCVEPFKAAVISLDLPSNAGLGRLMELRERYPSLPVVVMYRQDEADAAIEAIKMGAVDCVQVGGGNVNRTILALRRAFRFGLMEEDHRAMSAVAKRLRDTVKKMSAIGAALMGEKNLSRLLETIVTEARGVTGADGGTLYMLEGGSLHFRISQNDTLKINMVEEEGSDNFPSVELNEHNVSAYCAMHKKVVNIEDLYGNCDFDFTGPKQFDQAMGYDTRSMLVVPLLNKESEVIGVMQLINAKDPSTGQSIAFHEDLVDVVRSFAGQAAVAIENFRLQRAKLQEQKTRNDFGVFYIVTILLFVIGNALPDMSNLTGLYKMLASWGAVLVLLAPLAYFVKRVGLPLSHFGLTFKGGRQAIKEALIFSAIMLPIMFGLKALIGPADEAFFSWKLTNHYTPVEFKIKMSLYFFHSFVQELGARGVIQTSLLMFFSTVHYLVPIFVVSLMFGISHLHMGLLAVTLTFIVSFLFGYVYNRHKTLVGVSVLHYILGFAAMALGWV